MGTTYSAEMAFLVELSSKAGHELMKFFGKEVGIRHKADNSLVTDADLASEKFIIDTLHAKRPGDIICSEEAGLSSAERRKDSSIWVIDPLDGTTNFSNHYPFFCVSIARAVFTANGRMKVMSGAVHDPIRNKTYVAERGRGAWVNGKQIHIAKSRPPQDAFLVTGFAYHHGDHLKKDIDFFMAVAQTCQSIRRDGAAALDMALVAEGVYDGYWEAGLKPWDLAAGGLLVEEAGGLVRNYHSSSSDPFDAEIGDVICGTPPVVNFIENLV